MDAVSALGTTAPSTGSPATGQKTLIEEGHDRFIKLLVAQLKNQDPMSPLDNAQFTTQLAQISTVQGIEKLNTVMAEMKDAFTNSQQLSAVGLVGKTAYVDGDGLVLAGGNASGAVALESAADAVTVSILDASGKVIRTVDLGSLPAGVQNFAWDGKNSAGTAVVAGNYSFRVVATHGGDAVNAQTLTAGRVAGVSTGSGGISLTIGGANYALTDVRQFS